MLANKKLLVLFVFVLLVSIGAGVTLILANGRTARDGVTSQDGGTSTNPESDVAELNPVQDDATSTNAESEVAVQTHGHGHYDSGAVPVEAYDEVDLPTLSEALMKEFYDALRDIPSEDVYAEFFSWDDVDKDGDIREERVREVIAYAQAVRSQQ